MAQLWVDDRLKKEERDRVDRETAAQRNEEMKNILDLQVQLFNQYKMDREQQKQIDDQKLLDEWNRLKVVEEELQEHRRNNEIAVSVLVTRHLHFIVLTRYVCWLPACDGGKSVQPGACRGEPVRR